MPPKQSAQQQEETTMHAPSSGNTNNNQSASKQMKGNNNTASTNSTSQNSAQTTPSNLSSNNQTTPSSSVNNQQRNSPSNRSSTEQDQNLQHLLGGDGSLVGQATNHGQTSAAQHQAVMMLLNNAMSGGNASASVQQVIQLFNQNPALLNNPGFKKLLGFNDASGNNNNNIQHQMGMTNQGMPIVMNNNMGSSNQTLQQPNQQNEDLSSTISRLFNPQGMISPGGSNPAMMMANQNNMMNRNNQMMPSSNSGSNLVDGGWTQKDIDYLRDLLARFSDYELIIKCFHQRSRQEVLNKIQQLNNEKNMNAMDSSTPTSLKRGSISQPTPSSDPQQKKMKTESPINPKSYSTPQSPSSSTNNQANKQMVPSGLISTSNTNPLSSLDPSQSEKFINSLLSSNTLLINDIRSNIEQGKISANVQLITKFRDNIIQILTCMSMMEGIMSQMPPIPVKLSTICVPKPLTNTSNNMNQQGMVNPSNPLYRSVNMQNTGNTPLLN